MQWAGQVAPGNLLHSVVSGPMIFLAFKFVKISTWQQPRAVQQCISHLYVELVRTRNSTVFKVVDEAIIFHLQVIFTLNLHFTKPYVKHFV